jgi:hypothetical protein
MRPSNITIEAKYDQRGHRNHGSATRAIQFVRVPASKKSARNIRSAVPRLAIKGAVLSQDVHPTGASPAL